MTRQRSARTRLPIPHEHGAWAVFYASFLIGWAAAGRFAPVILFVLTTATALFLAHEPLAKLMRARRYGARADNIRYWARWLILFSILAAASSLILFLHYALWVLIVPAGVAAVSFSVHLLLVSRRKDRSVPAELLGIFGMTATSAAAHISLTGSLEATAFLLWGFCFLYFGSAVFYVKMRVCRSLKPADFGNRRNQCLGYHLAVLFALPVGAFYFGVPWLPLLGFVPVLARAFWHAIRPERSLNLRRIGYLEVLYTTLFTIVMGAGAFLSGF